MKKYILISVTTLLFGLLLQSQPQAEGSDLDIINLKHRNSEEIIPLIEPFLAPDAVITARGYKLIIKSTPDNLAEIRQLVDELDAALRQLMITVSINQQQSQQQRSLNARVQANRIDSNKRAAVDVGNTDSTASSSVTGTIVRSSGPNNTTSTSVNVNARNTSTQRDKPVHQSIRTTEGQWATIRTGQSIPVVERTRNPDGTVTQTTRFHSATSGFQVLPRLQGNERVILSIRPSQTSPARDNNGRFDTQSLETTIAGRLGEWIELGGVNQSEQSQGAAILHSTRSRAEQNSQIFVKIDIIQ